MTAIIRELIAYRGEVMKTILLLLALVLPLQGCIVIGAAGEAIFDGPSTKIESGCMKAAIKSLCKIDHPKGSPEYKQCVKQKVAETC